MISETSSTKAAWYDADGKKWTIELKFAVVQGRVECVSVRVAGAPLSVATLRAIPIGRLIKEQRRKAAQGLTWSLGSPQLALNAPVPPEKPSGGKRRGGRPPLPAEVLRQVALIYADAFARGEPPTKAVAETLHLSRSTAAKRVMKARELGYLPPTTERRAGGTIGNPPRRARRRS